MIFAPNHLGYEVQSPHNSPGHKNLCQVRNEVHPFLIFREANDTAFLPMTPTLLQPTPMSQALLQWSQYPNFHAQAQCSQPGLLYAKTTNPIPLEPTCFGARQAESLGLQPLPPRSLSLEAQSGALGRPCQG